MSDPFSVFKTDAAAAINAARQNHLGSLGLALEGKSVLEVGAGIGLHTPFFLERGCRVVATDGLPENVAELRRRLPGVEARVVDALSEADYRDLGTFDLVYCYGLLYHLRDPAKAIQLMARHCGGQLLLETIVSLGGYYELQLIRDYEGNNQAVDGVGCRPTRTWLMEQLKANFGYAYSTVTQPAFVDFENDWVIPRTQMNHRAIFVGSRVPLDAPGLLDQLPTQQPAFAR